MVFKANGAASFPESFRIHTLEVSLSLMVTSAPLWLLPITVSISKSPKRCFKSTIEGRSSISIRLRVCQNDAPSSYISQSPYFHKLGL